MNVEIWSEIDQLVLNSKYTDAIKVLETKIIDSGSVEFTPLIGAQISNNPADTNLLINQFLTHNKKSFDVQAIYIEMNGFDINYDRWYFDYFAFDNYSNDTEDLDWLCDWASDDWTPTTITGLESAQKVFEWYHENEIWKSRPDVKSTYEMAMLLIMCKFILFITTSASSESSSIGIPILATAHGFESIGRVKV